VFINPHQLFRHGAKNPSGFYPLDPHAAHDWQGGMGALTPVGIRYSIATLSASFNNSKLISDPLITRKKISEKFIKIVNAKIIFFNWFDI